MMRVLPAKLELEVETGDKPSASILLVNDGASSVAVDLRLGDFPSELGAASAFSLDPYLSFPERQFELRPGEARAVPINFDLPEPVEALVGSLHGVILFRFSGTETGDYGAKFINQIGVPVFVRLVGQAKPEGRLLDFQLPSGRWLSAADPLVFSVSFENLGNTYLNPSGKICLTDYPASDPTTESLPCVAIEPWFVLPGTERTRDVEWNHSMTLSWGHYRATLTLAPGYGNSQEASELEFWILPSMAAFTPQLIFIVGFLVLIVIKFKQWRTRKKR